MRVVIDLSRGLDGLIEGTVFVEDERPRVVTGWLDLLDLLDRALPDVPPARDGT